MAETYSVEILIPTARLAFAVRDGRVEFMAEHQPPEAYRSYQEFRRRHDVVGMTTFPNTVLLRGPSTILVDPGIHFQGEPVLAALAARGLSADDLDLVALTHAHLDHAGAVGDVVPPAPSSAGSPPVAVHVAETREPHWAAVKGALEVRDLRLLKGEEGELTDGVTWVRTQGHTEGGVCFRVPTADGLVVLCGDVIGPLVEDFAALQPPVDEPDPEALLRSWRLIRSWQPARIIPGHLQPLEPADWHS
jgi:glyoxylase-like metal-dependent hydrolase (beta-lactamase superfamily II)